MPEDPEERRERVAANTVVVDVSSSDEESSYEEGPEIADMVRTIQAITRRDPTEIHLALDAFGFDIDQVIAALGPRVN